MVRLGSRAVLIFDGDCGFCTTVATWAERRFSNGEAIAPWQVLGEHGLEGLGLDESQAAEAAWWVDVQGNRERGHRAVGRALQAAGGAYRWAGWLALSPPTSGVAAGVYRLVARWRHRLPGGTPAC